MQSKNQKREKAVELVNAWRTLTPTQQLASLDARLGVGVGAKRQRTKLDALLHPPTPVIVPQPVAPVVTTLDAPKKKKFKKGNK
jgi:hypothetical protein